MDAVAVATANAAVLTIYETVLVVSLEAAVKPASRLKLAGERAVRQLDASRAFFRIALSVMPRQMAEEVPSDTGEARALARAILPPEPEPDPLAGALAAKREADIAQRNLLQLMLRLKSDQAARAQFAAERHEGREEHEELLAEVDTRDEASIRTELEDVEHELRSARPSAERAPVLDQREAVRGRLLIALLVKFWSEPPLAETELSTKRAIDLWNAGLGDLGSLAATLRTRGDDADRVAEAACSEPPLAVRPGLGPALETYMGLRRDLLAQVVFKFREGWERVLQARAMLDQELRTYGRDAPRRSYRRLLVAGVVAGAAAFVTGVVLPLAIDGVPRALYAYVPAGWYCTVLIVLCVGAIRRARAA